jgi:hypothetical protein
MRNCRKVTKSNIHIYQSCWHPRLDKCQLVLFFWKEDIIVTFWCHFLDWFVNLLHWNKITCSSRRDDTPYLVVPFFGQMYPPDQLQRSSTASLQRNNSPYLLWTFDPPTFWWKCYYGTANGTNYTDIKCTKGRKSYCEIMNVRCNWSLDVLDLLLILLALPKLLAFWFLSKWCESGSIWLEIPTE